MVCRRVFACLLLVGMAATMLAGCGGSKVSKGNFDKVQNGMTQAEVEKVLGEGTEEAGGGGAIGGIVASGKILSWTDGEKKITVTFANGKVVAKTQSGL
ncbi:MAG: hypothetical protein WBF17_22135 [Phycisphaerae bacterium]